MQTILFLICIFHKTISISLVTANDLKSFRRELMFINRLLIMQQLSKRKMMQKCLENIYEREINNFYSYSTILNEVFSLPNFCE